MSTRKRVQWGVLVGESVRPLPSARNVNDAMLHVAHLDTKKRVKAVVVYRDSDSEQWRRWIDERPVPTQLNLFDLEAR